jgi:hypothetical protein
LVLDIFSVRHLKIFLVKVLSQLKTFRVEIPLSLEDILGLDPLSIVIFSWRGNVILLLGGHELWTVIGTNAKFSWL